MSDAVYAQQYLAAAQQPYTLGGFVPDRVGEELADDARIWRVYDEVSRQDDMGRIVDWNRGLDNLALFATLFSAVTTAFLLEARKDMTPDYTQLSFLVMNATNHGTHFVQDAFVIPPSARAVNCLWTASLILSLLAALISVMGKEWLAMYAYRPDCNLRQWAELRTYRTRCIERWFMPHIIASAQPLLLHASFILFLAGLVIFISPDPFAHNITLGLSLFAGLVYVATVLGAIVFSDSPFKSPATQSVREALSLIAICLRDVLSRPKRNLIPTLQLGINDLVAPGMNAIGHMHRRIRRYGFAELFRDVSLPHGHLDLRRLSLVSYLCSIRMAVVAAIHATTKIPRAVITELRHLRLKAFRASILSSYRNLRISDTFFSTRWTDIPAERRPELVAQSLSWLNTASQSPDVFSAVVFALGDLEIGGQVGRFVSSELRARLRAEISQSWHTADFLTLSRYVLAESNLPGDPVLEYSQFVACFKIGITSPLRCEDGVAAMVRFPVWISPDSIARYLPNHVYQPRMVEFLGPYLQAEALIVFANRYWGFLAESYSFNLEVELYQRLHPQMHEAYASKVLTEYGGKPGAIELLTFLCTRRHMTEGTNSAAVELIMQILEAQPLPQPANPCLAYLFGDTTLEEFAWPREKWSSLHLFSLFESLKPCLHRAGYWGGDMRPAPDPNLKGRFRLVLTRTVVFLLGKSRDIDDPGYLRVRFLHSQLCNTQSPLEPREQADIIGLILRQHALSGIADKGSDEALVCGLAILATVTGHISRLLSNGDTFTEGVRLFIWLVLSYCSGESTSREAWDLGNWICHDAPPLVEEYPSAAGALQDFHEGMTSIYSLREGSEALHEGWDRIGYPGRPGDVFSDPFLSLGAFFDSAEAPPEASSRRKTVRWKL